MGGFEDPICVLRVRYDLVLPFDLEMAGSPFEQRWTWEIVDVEFGFGRHGGKKRGIELEVQLSTEGRLGCFICIEAVNDGFM